MSVCVTGATGYIGAHVAREASERLGPLRVTYRDEGRLERLAGVDAEPVRADVLDRAALRRAFRGCTTVIHCAGFVASRPVELVWKLNALAPRLVVEAAAAEKVRRVVVTSSVSGIGPAPPGRAGTEDGLYRGGGLGLTYPDAKHEGEAEAFAAGARHGIEVVVVNPAYVFGAALDRDMPGETSTRMIGNYLRGRLPAMVDGETNVVDVRDVAKGHLLAAERGRPGERYVLGGHDLRWVELFERVAELSGVRHPLVVLPPEAGGVARAAEALGLPALVRAEGVVLMGTNWRYSSAKARRELGYRRAAARRHAARHDRLVPRADRQRTARRRVALAAVGGRARAPPGGPRGTARPAAGRGAAGRPQAGGAVSFFPRDEYFMRLALREAERALEHDDVPIGAVVVHGGEVIAAARNERELRGDPTAHAEILALREASTALAGWRLLDTVLYVTLEPCAMCAGAIVLARVPRVVWAADDPKAGAAGSVMNVLAEPRLNHRPEAAGGLLAEEASSLLRAFFAARRS